MKNKTCPICKIPKPIEEYHQYFSKVRNKTRIGNYCKPCAREKANERAKIYYREHREKKLHYQLVERKEWNRQDFKKNIDELTDRYILNKLNQTTGESIKELRKFPEMIEAKRTKILTTRIIKKLKQNGKK